MKVLIKDIGPKGADINVELSAESIGFTKNDYLYFVSPVSVQAHLDRYENTVLVKVAAHGRFSVIDYKTSERLEQDWQQDFELDFEIGKDTEYLEIDEDIRQEVILRVPLKVSTKEAERIKIKNKVVKYSEETPNEETETYQPFKNLKLKKAKDKG